MWDWLCWIEWTLLFQMYVVNVLYYPQLGVLVPNTSCRMHLGPGAREGPAPIQPGHLVHRRTPWARCSASLLHIPWVATQAVRFTGCSKSYDLCHKFTPCNTWISGGNDLCRVGVTASQLDLPFQAPLPVAGCGRLQLVAPHWATTVALLQVNNNWLHILW